MAVDCAGNVSLPLRFDAPAFLTPAVYGDASSTAHAVLGVAMCFFAIYRFWQRHELVRTLAGTSGLELLSACTTEDQTAPFVKITHTSAGKKLKDKPRAQDLTANARATATAMVTVQNSLAASQPLIVCRSKESREISTPEARRRVKDHLRH